MHVKRGRQTLQLNGFPVKKTSSSIISILIVKIKKSGLIIFFFILHAHVKLWSEVHPELCSYCTAIILGTTMLILSTIKYIHYMYFTVKDKECI